MNRTDATVRARVFALYQQYVRPENRLLVHATQAVIVYVVWVWVASIFPENLMPTPVETGQTLYGMFAAGVVLEHLFATLWRVLVAFFGVLAISLPVGMLMGLREFWGHFVLPYLVLGMTIPGVVWAVAAVLVFGFGDLAAVVIGMIIPTAYATIQVWKGTENIDTDLVTMGNAFDLSLYRMARRIVIPNIAPELFAAARFGIGLTFKLMVVAELFATNDGIGAMLFQTYDVYRYQEAWAWAVVIFVLIAGLEAVLRRLERRAFAYREESNLVAAAG